MPDGDAALLEGIAACDQRALRALYERHAGRLLAASQRILGDAAEAEELVQETFLEVWNRARLFDRSRGSATGWVMTIGRNRAIDRLRARATRRRTVDTIRDAEPERGPTPEHHLRAAQTKRTVDRALEALTPDQRAVIELAYYDGLSQAEIAVKLGSPLGTVKGRVRAALDRLAGRVSRDSA